MKNPGSARVFSFWLGWSERAGRIWLQLSVPGLAREAANSC